MQAVLLISHGSRLAKTKEEIVELTELLKKCTGIPIFEYAFLEIESPSIPQGLDMCVIKGATKVTVLLNFLNSGRHVGTDIPQIVENARQKYPQVSFSITTPVGQHPKMVDLFIDLISHA